MIYLYAIAIIPLFYCTMLHAQIQVDQYVVGTIGSTATAGNISLSYTAGEPVVTTVEGNNFFLTQGFHQPSVVFDEQLLLEVNINNASCIGTQDGYAVINILNGTEPYTISWSNNGGNNDTSNFYTPGTYYVNVSDAQGKFGTVEFEITAETTENCGLHIYSGITPNGDGINDEWIIDGIETYSENVVYIHDRWGNLIWDAPNYNNQTIVWKGTNNNNKLMPAGTYFYLIELNTGESHKGWVQITK